MPELLQQRSVALNQSVCGTAEMLWKPRLLIVAFRSSALLGLAYPILLFTIPHRFSMGLRSGEFAGQLRTGIPWSLNRVLVALALCAGAKSCWKMKSASPALFFYFLLKASYTLYRAPGLFYTGPSHCLLQPETNKEHCPFVRHTWRKLKVSIWLLCFKVYCLNVIECWLNECWWWSEGPYGADWQPRFRQSAPGQLWLQL